MNMNVKDLLDCRTQDELLRFLHCKKTMISCLDQPHILLHQLRDHNLVPKHLYEKVKKMKSKEKRKDGMYEILDLIEKTKASSVHMFWFCVFEDHVLQQYPALRLLRNSLMDESFRFCENLPDPEDQPEREQNPGHSKEATAKEKKRGKKRKKSADEAEEDEQLGPSSSAHKQKKLPKKPVFSTPVKKGQRQDIWTWPIYQTTLPITCGDKQATLHRNKLATGEKCIQFKGRWFAPPEFEKFAGRGKWKNWKVSIRCRKTPLQKLIEGGHLQPPRRKRRCVKKSKRVLFPASPSESPSSHSDSSEEMESSRDDLHERSNEREQEDREGQVTEDNEEEEEEEETEPVDPSVFQASTLPVRCGSVKGVLHKYRFVSGSRGKSIRTEDRWLTPEDFVKEESTLMERHWKKDIHCYGKMLNFLLQKKILVVHSLLCKCDLCDPEQQNQQEQDNDDTCFICNTEGELVCCDKCPRAFHGQCHLPALQEDTLGKQWMCTYCVLHTNRLWWDTDHMSQEDAMNRPITQYTLLCEYLLLCLYKEDVQHVFTEDPTATVSDYTRVISEPMWLNKVRTKLCNKQYSRLSQFVSDIRLIISNCHVFNRDNTEFDRMGSRLSDVFDRELRTIFSIQ